MALRREAFTVTPGAAPIPPAPLGDGAAGPLPSHATISFSVRPGMARPMIVKLALGAYKLRVHSRIFRGGRTF